MFEDILRKTQDPLVAHDEKVKEKLILESRNDRASLERRKKQQKEFCRKDL